jgi:hypothetical protein
MNITYNNNVMENKQKTKELIKWSCCECGKDHESNPNVRHEMDFCECGKSGVDAEIWYTRVMSKVKFIKESLNGKSE